MKQHPNLARFAITDTMRVWLRQCLFLICVVVLPFAANNAKADQDGFLDPEKAFVLTADMSRPDVIALHFKIADGYYMYRERFSFAFDTEQIKVAQAKFPEGKIKFDPTFNKEMELYFKDATIELSITGEHEAQTLSTVVLTVNGQGCATAGLCYPPMDFVVRLKRAEDGKGWTIVSNKTGLFAKLADGQWRDILFGSNDLSLAGLLSSTGLLEIALLFFVLGVLLALTPCVLPMVPILSVLLVGEQHHVSRSRGLLLSAAYVAGMSVVYTALGVAAGLSGAGLAAWLQTPWVLALFAILLATLALAMFDVFQFQMPASIQTRLIVKNSHILGGRVAASAMMGALSALIVGPCVAAPLAGALLYISQTGDVLLGGLALFAMAWGMGVPLLLMGASAGKLMPRTGPWMEGVKKFFGLLLLATAWWMVTPVLPTWVQIFGWALLAMLGAMLLRTFDSLPQDAGFGGVLRKTLGMMLVLLCAIWLVGIASGGRSLLQPLSHLAVFTPSTEAQAKQTPEEGLGTTRATLTGPASATSINPMTSNSSKQQLLATENTNGQAKQSGSVSQSLQAQQTQPQQPQSQQPQSQKSQSQQIQTLQIQPALKTIQVGTLQFHRITSVAQLDAVLANATTPVMLDFYADWCVSCKEMESFTFVDPKVASRMSQVLLLQADVTANNPDDRALLKRFKLFGPPGIIFFTKDGKERRDIRVVGFQDANRFAATLDRVLK